MDQVDMEDSPASQERPENEKLIIVGIGASAGGLETLRKLVPKLPLHERVIYILAQHLDPKHSSMMASILSRETSMPVDEVAHGQRLEGANFYIVPPGVDAFYSNGHILLERATGVGPKPSIDRLFFSLSEHHHGRNIGVILSGTGTDGAHGIRAIKAEGGITIAQQESTAKFSNMPHAAISTGQVDLILPPEAIARQIQDFIDQPDDALHLVQQSAENSEDEIEEILLLLLRQTGSDFRDYKRNTLLRRLERRMTVHKITSLKAYIALLQQKPEELYELHNDILISVTSFFRDPDVFQVLRDHIANLFSQSNHDIRIWVAGCATGEEAYTIAMLLSEYLGNRLSSYKIQIFGTDLYDGVLAIARQGIYPKEAVKDIPPNLVDKYFTQKDGAYQLINLIRNMVVFARHNLVCDPPFSNLNLISCRNVLIYFNQTLQRNVLESFHYSLKNGGLLMLGKSETVGECENLFATLDRKARLYRHRDEIKGRMPFFLHSRPLHGQPQRTVSRDKSKYQLRDVVERMFTDVFQPRCLLLNDRQEVLYLRGDMSPFLYFPEGHLGTGILDLIHDELRQDMRALLGVFAQKHESDYSKISPPEAGGTGILANSSMRQSRSIGSSGLPNS